MNFLQRIGNALSRFMYGRNGVDRLTLTMVWTALVLDIINIFLREKVPLAYSIIGTVAGIITLLALFRMVFPQSGEAAGGERTVHGEGLVAHQPPYCREKAAADG